MFEVAMLHNNMFEQLEDTEMAVDAGKLATAGEDIDIDLDFSDHGQDEMMTEEIHDPTYDMMLGDMVATEQDEVMTDEGLDEQIFDEEITDAPVEAVAETELDSLTHTELENKPELLLNNQASIEGKEESINTGGPETTGAVEEVHSALISATGFVDTENDNPNAATDHDKNQIERSAQEEVEELITWESDEEEEEPAEAGNVAGEAESIEPVALAPIDSKEEDAGEELEHTTDETVPISSDSADPNEDIQATNDGALAEVAQYHKEDNNAIDQTTNEGVREDVTELAKHNFNDKADAVSAADPDSDELKNSDSHAAVLEEQALQQLHPIVIRYMDEEMSLFPPTIEGEHTMFFLSEKKLAFESCENLFRAFREVLGESINKDEVLILACPDLGLDIQEGIPETSTLSIAQLLHLYLGLSNHDGHEQAPPMPFVLKHHYDISARLNHLYALLDSGKGLSAVPGYSATEHIESGGTNEEVQEYGDKQDDSVDNPNQTSREAPKIELPSDESNGNQDDAATPRPEHDPEEEYDLDFRSPAAVQRNQVLSTAEITTGVDTKPNGTSVVLEQENAAAQDAVKHDDDEEKEILNGSGIYAEHNGNQSSNSLNSNIDQQDTNSATDDVLPATEDTNYSNVNEGSTSAAEDDPSKEDHFDLEDPTEEHDTTESHPEPSATIDKPTIYTTGSEIDKTAADNHHSVEVDDDFEEIGYSSSEDEIEEPLPPTSLKHKSEALHGRTQSPKRSIDDLEDPARDVKKLRSI